MAVEKFEYYDTGQNTGQYIRDTLWVAQSFTPSAAHSITKVRLYMKKSGAAINTITVEIQKVDDNGHPDGTVMATGTVDGDTLGGSYEWKEISFNTPADLASGTQYTIVVDARDSSSLSLLWGLDSSGAYTGGSYMQSSNSGSVWTITSAADFLFEEWGNVYVFSPPIPTGLNFMKTIRRLVVAGFNEIWYEDI